MPKPKVLHYCLICYDPLIQKLSASREANEKLFSNFCELLNVKIPRVLKSDVGVQFFPLCKSCTAIALRLSQLQEKIESLQFEVESNIKCVKELVVNSDTKKGGHESTSIKVNKCSTKEEGFHEFRKQIIAKYENEKSNAIKTSGPGRRRKSCPKKILKVPKKSKQAADNVKDTIAVKDEKLDDNLSDGNENPGTPEEGSADDSWLPVKTQLSGESEGSETSEDERQDDDKKQKKKEVVTSGPPKRRYNKNSWTKRDNKMYLKEVEIISIEGGFKCGKCSWETKSSKLAAAKYQMSLHVKGLHTEKIPCEICGKEFSAENLEKHKEKIHHGTTVLCDICSKPFRCTNSLPAHKWTHKSVEEKEAALASGIVEPRIRRSRNKTASQQCRSCGKLFVHKWKLVKHEKTHLPPEERKCHQCPTCGKLYASQDILRGHMLMVHERNKVVMKWFECLTCGMKFPQSSRLTKHMRKHTGEKPYICHVCSKGFSDSGRLRLHLITHTNNRPYKCDLCESSYRRPQHVTRHKIAMHGKPSVSNKPVLPKLPKPRKPRNPKNFQPSEAQPVVVEVDPILNTEYQQPDFGFAFNPSYFM